MHIPTKSFIQISNQELSEKNCFLVYIYVIFKSNYMRLAVAMDFNTFFIHILMSENHDNQDPRTITFNIM